MEVLQYQMSDFAAHIGGLISGFAMYTLLTLSKEKGI